VSGPVPGSRDRPSPFEEGTLVRSRIPLRDRVPKVTDDSVESSSASASLPVGWSDLFRFRGDRLMELEDVDKGVRGAR
jgi:hypothetical protein